MTKQKSTAKAGSNRAPRVDVSALRLEDSNLRIGLVKAGRKSYWIKNYHAENVSWGRWGHAAVSVLIPSPVFKASPILGPAEAKQYELDKLRAFQAAGFDTPTIVHEGRLHFVMSDEGPTLNRTLIEIENSDPARHDKLLCGWIEEIGRVHASGLCHGRPHVKDIIYKRGKWVHLDFEEAPETVMPLETAQARDLILVFHQMVRRMKNSENLHTALEMYRTEVPEKNIAAARESLDSLVPLAKFAELICRIKQWKDIYQFSQAIRFLKENL